MKIKNNKGFTLIEIIAVLIIVSIISSVAIVKFVNVDKGVEKQVTNFEDKATERRNNAYKAFGIEVKKD